MEEKKLIEADRRGGYCVLFLNTTGLRIDNIKEIFSEFGEVREVRNLGSPKTIHFVTYKSYDDAQRAVDCLADHPVIKLRHHTAGKKNKRADSPKEPAKPKDLGKPKKNCDPPSNLQVKNKNKNKSPEEGKLLRPKESRVPDLVDRRGHVMPNDYVPRKVLPATELVFGNVHPRCDAYSLLRLLKPYDPIAVSEIHPYQRYCLVYLRNADVAAEVENAYDDKILAGRRLLVLRTDRLLEEVGKV